MKPLSDFSSDMLSAFRKRNQRRLRKLNDDILVAASMDFNQPMFNLAVFSYILSKIVSKPRFLRREYEQQLKAIEKIMENLTRVAEVGGEDEILAAFANLEREIVALEKEDPRFVVDLMTKGKLKMAATLYAQGMSLGVASDMTGMDKQEILHYSGETMMFDRLKDEISISERMKLARRLLAE